MRLALYTTLVIAFCVQLTTLCLSATLAWGGLEPEHAIRPVETAHLSCSLAQASTCIRTRGSDEYPGPVGWTDGPLLFANLIGMILLVPWSRVALHFAAEKVLPRDVTLHATAGVGLLVCSGYQILLSQGGARQLRELEQHEIRNVHERIHTLEAITWASLFLFIHHAVLGIAGSLINRSGAKNAVWG